MNALNLNLEEGQKVITKGYGTEAARTVTVKCVCRMGEHILQVERIQNESLQ